MTGSEFLKAVHDFTRSPMAFESEHEFNYWLDITKIDGPCWACDSEVLGLVEIVPIDGLKFVGVVITDRRSR